MTSIFRELRSEFSKRLDPARAKILAGFFKCGKGEYAEGDEFYGITVPETRRIARAFVRRIAWDDLGRLLMHGKHEERLCALLMLVDKFKKTSAIERKKIVDFYISHTAYINNWDLVDLTAHSILGAYFFGRSKKPFFTLARSKHLWERRMAIIATFYNIRNGDYRTTFEIADVLLRDTHDLIHKAVGWMLREVGKRHGKAALEEFLRPRYKTMPRTMLRYAIERFPERERKAYLTK